MEQVMWLTNPTFIQKFQRFCGVEARDNQPPGVVSQETGKAEQINGTVKHRNGYHINQDINGNNNNNNNGTIVKNGLHKNGTVHQPMSTPYVIRYKSVYYLAKFGAVLGDELFYLIFFPFWIWNINSVVGRQTAYVWCLVMYLGQATKDYLRWPRPPSPPVFRLETTHLQEYSMPSTHAMSGIAIPGALLYIMTTRYEFSLLLALPIGLTWSGLVCLCRLYLGVHTVLDVLAGSLYSVVILCCALPYVQEFDLFIRTHPYAPIVVFITALALCTVCYPSKDQNSAKGDAVQIMSSTAGTAIGIWFNHMFHHASQPEVTPSLSVTTLSLTWLGLSILRLLSGAFLTFLIREFIKRAALKGVSYVYGLKRPDKTNPSVQTAYKFITYLCLGVCMLALVPAVHKIMGILRPNFYFEIE